VGSFAAGGGGTISSILPAPALGVRYPKGMSAPRWLPNAISMGRIGLVPVWILVAELARDAPSLGVALPVVLVVLGLSDVVDGYLARRYGLATRFGATLDAVADKLAQLTFVTYLAWFAGAPLQALPSWFWGVVVGRDALLAVGYLVLLRRRGAVDTEHRAHGKIASVLLFFVVLAAISPGARFVTPIAVWVTAMAIVFSTADYLWQGLRALRSRSV
jgi:phosphatidylglycerophosphate synthase